MPTFGSDGGFLAAGLGGIIDAQGNTIISADTSAGAAPLGYGPLTQVRASLPNGLMSLPPINPGSVIVANQNDLPGWIIDNYSNGNITVQWVAMTSTESTAIQNAYLAASGRQVGIAATGTYAGNGALKVSFGTAGSGDYVTITTQAPYASAPIYGLSGGIVAAAVNDAGTAVGTAIIPNLAVSADITLLDDAGTAVGTAIAGTYFTGTACLTKLGRSEDTWDTASTASATVKFAATGTMSGSAYVLISSVYATPIETGNIRASLLTTTGDTIYASQPSLPARLAIGTAGQVLTVGTAGIPTWATASGGSGGRVILSYSASGTWVVPTGVTTFDAILVGAAGGGASGALSATFTQNAAGTGVGGPGGGASGYGYLANIPVTAASTVTITLGAAGSGGTARSYSKAGGVAAANQSLAPTTGGNGGASSITTSLGTVISITGGGGAGTATVGSPGVVTVSSVVGNSVAAGTAAASIAAAPTSPASSSVFLPYFGPTSYYAGSAGVTATNAGTGSPSLGSGGTIYAETGFGAGGAFGGAGTTGTAAAATAAQAENGGPGRYGAGGGGGGAAIRYSNAGTVTISLQAGAGGTTAAYGCGGAGGGGLRLNIGAQPNTGDLTASTVSLTSGAGTNGSGGFAVISYITPGTAV